MIMILFVIFGAENENEIRLVLDRKSIWPKLLQYTPEQETHQQMRQVNVTGKFKLPPEHAMVAKLYRPYTHFPVTFAYLIGASWLFQRTVTFFDYAPYK